MKINCPNCGYQIADSDEGFRGEIIRKTKLGKFCKNCGSSLAQDDTQEEQFLPPEIHGELSKRILNKPLICRTCGTEVLNHNEKFCTICGSSFYRMPTSHKVLLIVFICCTFLLSLFFAVPAIFIISKHIYEKYRSGKSSV